MNLRAAAQSIGAWGVFAVPTGLFGVAMPIVYPLLRARSGDLEAQRRLRAVAHRFCRMYFPALTTIVPATSVVFVPPEGVRSGGRGTIYVSNHAGTLDPVFLLAHIEDFVIVGKDELSRVPIFGRALAGMGTIFTDRSNRFEAREVMSSLGDVIRRGDSILAFPQGHRKDRWLKKDLKRGIFRLALETGAPIRPIALVNSTSFLRPHQFWFDITEPVTGWVVAADPVEPEGRPDDPAAVNALRRIVWERIDEILRRYG